MLYGQEVCLHGAPTDGSCAHGSLSLKEDFQTELTWPSLAVLGEKLLVYFPLFLLFFDFRLLVDLLNGFRTLIGSSGHPVVLKGEQNTGPAHS